MNFVVLALICGFVAATQFTHAFPVFVLLAFLKGLLILWIFMDLKVAKYWGLIGTSGLGAYFALLYLIH